MTKPIELYYWPTPNGWKISIALEEMGLPYEVKLIDIGAGDQFKSEFLIDDNSLSLSPVSFLAVSEVCIKLLADNLVLFIVSIHLR